MPLPIPQQAEVIVIQLLFDSDFHAQPADVVKLMLPAPPVESNDANCGLIVNVQPVDVCPSCVTVNVRPAMLIVPERGVEPRLSRTR